MLPIELPSVVLNHLLLELECLQLKSAIHEAVINSLQLSENSNVFFEGRLIIEGPGDHTPVTLLFSDDKNGELRSQASRTPLQSKPCHPPITCLNDLQNANQILLSESRSSTSMLDYALDLTKSTSVSSSIQESPMKQGTEQVNEMMKLFQLNLFPSTSLPLFQPTAINSTMSSSIQFQPYSVASSPKKQRRFGGTLVQKPFGVRQFRCNQCDCIFGSLRNLDCHTHETHGGYKCHLCKKPFTQRSNLQRHALKHVDFKPFECSLCKKAYYRKDHLMRHMQKTHPYHPADESIQVKLRTSESLDYLRQTREEDLPTTTDLLKAYSISENCLGSEGREVEVMETGIKVDDTNNIKSPVKFSTDFFSDEWNSPSADEFPLPSPPH
nr:zinc finger protein [Hymenolepis microstoma]